MKRNGEVTIMTFTRTYSMQLSDLEREQREREMEALSPGSARGERRHSSGSHGSNGGNPARQNLDRAYGHSSFLASPSNKSRGWIRLIWTLHFFGGAFMLVLGMLNNHWDR